MALAVRGITLEKGVDPRDTALIAFGGGGPLHASAIAREIGIPRVIVPPLPACFSALGMLMTDLKHDLVRTCARPLRGDFGDVNRLLAQLRAEGTLTLADAGMQPSDVACAAYLDLNYAGQQWTLPTPVGESLTAENAQAARTKFDSLYEARFGHSFANLPVEIVNVRVSAIGRRPKPAFPRLEKRTSGAAAPLARRQVYFHGRGFVDCPIYDRARLLAGDEVAGPAIIEEGLATVLLEHGDHAAVAGDGCIVMRIG
jgi:N-methylhydantoinase A